MIPLPLDLRDPSLEADAVCAALGLQPHPEGGHYRELWRDEAGQGARGAASTILFLLAAGERSHWHRVDASEIWLWHAGAPLHLGIAPGLSGTASAICLGSGLDAHLQAVVPAGAWQEARSMGAWTLVGCVVAPAFRFDGFMLAQPDFVPPGWPPVPAAPRS